MKETIRFTKIERCLCRSMAISFEEGNSYGVVPNKERWGELPQCCQDYLKSMNTVHVSGAPVQIGSVYFQQKESLVNVEYSAWAVYSIDPEVDTDISLGEVSITTCLWPLNYFVRGAQAVAVIRRLGLEEEFEGSDMVSMGAIITLYRPVMATGVWTPTDGYSDRASVHPNVNGSGTAWCHGSHVTGSIDDIHEARAEFSTHHRQLVDGVFVDNGMSAFASWKYVPVVACSVRVNRKVRQVPKEFMVRAAVFGSCHAAWSTYGDHNGLNNPGGRTYSRINAPERLRYSSRPNSCSNCLVSVCAARDFEPIVGRKPTISSGLHRPVSKFLPLVALKLWPEAEEDIKKLMMETMLQEIFLGGFLPTESDIAKAKALEGDVIYNMFTKGACRGAFHNFYLADPHNILVKNDTGKSLKDLMPEWAFHALSWGTEPRLIAGKLTTRYSMESISGLDCARTYYRDHNGPCSLAIGKGKAYLMDILKSLVEIYDNEELTGLAMEYTGLSLDQQQQNPETHESTEGEHTEG